ncbi:sterile alpha motif domain-containing protein 7 [Hyperolius riggenbachi]|uniref:sterile alpha motif domain-containing protein 7 n=1 Tax=Hyperolius riggenbachi TaxID=752182 RepID=UPI0035A3A03C
MNIHITRQHEFNCHMQQDPQYSAKGGNQPTGELGRLSHTVHKAADQLSRLCYEQHGGKRPSPPFLSTLTLREEGLSREAKPRDSVSGRRRAATLSTAKLTTCKVYQKMSMLGDQPNLESKHLYQLSNCMTAAELRQRQEILMRNQMMSVNPQVVVPTQQRMPVMPGQFEPRLLERGEMLPSSDMILPGDTRQLHLTSQFGSSVPSHSSVMSNRAYSAPGYSNFLHTEPLDFLARRQELLQKQNMTRIDMEMNAMYHQREVDKTHRKGFPDLDSPFLYHGMPPHSVAFRGRQLCPEGQLPSDLFVHRNALEILHGGALLKAGSPYAPISSLQRERARRPGRRTSNQKVPESSISVSKNPSENKPSSSPITGEEDKEEKKEEDTETFNKSEQGKPHTDSAMDKNITEMSDNHEKTSRPLPLETNRGANCIDKEVTNSGTAFEDRFIYQPPVTMPTSPYGFPVSVNPSLIPGTHSLFLNREDIPAIQDIHKLTSQDVYDFICSLPGCSSYAQVFKDHDIDGVTLPLLTEDHLLDTMGLKLGPALKIRSQICCRLGNIFHMTSLSLPGPVSSAATVPSEQPSEVISPIPCNNSSSNTVPSPCAHDSDSIKSTDIIVSESKENSCDVTLPQTDFQMSILKS